MSVQSWFAIGERLG